MRKLGTIIRAGALISARCEMPAENSPGGSRLWVELLSIEAENRRTADAALAARHDAAARFARSAERTRAPPAASCLCV
jgi:hypothetical protein